MATATATKPAPTKYLFDFLEDVPEPNAVLFDVRHQRSVIGLHAGIAFIPVVIQGELDGARMAL